MAYIYLTIAIIAACGGWTIVAGIFAVASLLTFTDKDFQE